MTLKVPPKRCFAMQVAREKTTKSPWRMVVRLPRSTLKLPGSRVNGCTHTSLGNSKTRLRVMLTGLITWNLCLWSQIQLWGFTSSPIYAHSERDPLAILSYVSVSQVSSRPTTWSYCWNFSKTTTMWAQQCFYSSKSSQSRTQPRRRALLPTLLMTYHLKSQLIKMIVMARKGNSDW